MRRSGALTLGAVLMLGGVTGGRGDQLSGSVGVGDPSSWGGFVLPTLPENWADMPFRLTASESVSYNSNIFAVPTNGVTLARQTRGDFTSSSSFGVSTKGNWYDQAFFLDGNLGVIRYLHQVASDSIVYSVNTGINWTITSRCTGTVVGAFTRTPTLITEQVGTGINYGTTTAVNETGKCTVSNGFSLVFNSGLTKLNNSNSLNAVNNSTTEMLSAGIEYAKGADTVTALASISDTNYANRTGLGTIVGLSNAVALHSFSFSYTKQFDPSFSVSAQAGLVGVTNGFDLSLPKTVSPTFSFSANWAVTPRLGLTASASRAVGAPTTVIGNAQTSYQTNLTLSYAATPKVNVTASASAGYSSAEFSQALVGTMFANFLTNTDYYSATAGVNYAMTPFLGAALTAAFTERVQNHVMTPQDVITVSLNYRPY
jgi:hypothetical protein